MKKLLQFGARRDVKSNNNLTPVQLARDKEKYNIVELLDEKSCLTKFFLFRTPMMKVERTSGNVVFFLILHFFVEVSIFFIVLPFFQSKEIFIVYATSFCLLLSVYFYLICSDPGEMRNKEKADFVVRFIK